MGVLDGRCLCGAIEVELAAMPVAVGLCHCTHCRRTGGSAFSVIGFVPEAAVAVRGAVALFADRGESGLGVDRHFCPTCGSPVETVAEAMAGSGLRLVKMGLFDPAAYPAPSSEVFCRYRVGWLPPLADTVTFDQMPPAAGEEPS